MKNKNAEREADKTLSLVDSVRHVHAGPFFYTRLKARMQSETTEHKVSHAPYFRFSLAVIGFLLLVLLNGYSLWHSLAQTNDAVKKQQIASFAEEYTLTYNLY
jgi:hypothetical protein